MRRFITASICTLLLLAPLQAKKDQVRTWFDANQSAFSLLGGKWATNQVPYYVNVGSCAGPLSLDPAQVLSDIQTAAGVWTDQTNADIELVYVGETTRIGIVNDGQNTISCSSGDVTAQLNHFLAQSSGSWFQDGNGHYTDADVVLWIDTYPSYPYITSNMPCPANFFILDVVAHETGHMLGLDHSTDLQATMYPTIAVCSTQSRTLYSDDIRAIERLYGKRHHR